MEILRRVNKFLHGVSTLSIASLSNFNIGFSTRWNVPEPERRKLNIDGSSLDGGFRMAYCGVIRDCIGQCI